MAFMLTTVLLFVAAVSAGHLPITPYSTAYQQSQIALPSAVAIRAPVFKQVEYEAPAKYDFSYSVNDPNTGDVKEQSESRNGDVVHGFYSLIDADGFRRIVEYTADAQKGFNAVVRREPLGYISIGHSAPYATPGITKVTSPILQYSSPSSSFPAVSLGQYAASPFNYYQH